MMNLQRICGVMLGYQVARPDDIVRDEVTGQKCEALYEAAYEARIRITKAIDGKEEDDNTDALCIAEAYEEMLRILCRKAFLYGKRFASAGN